MEIKSIVRVPVAAIFCAAVVLWMSPASAENQVAAENSLQGTSAWQLTNPATGREVEGYASATSVDRGDAISLYVNTAAPTFSLEVFRMGWYQGLGGRRVYGPVDVAGRVQVVPQPNASTGLVDCNWVESYALQTRDPTTGVPWRTGVYVARLTESVGHNQAYIIFVVRDDGHRPDILFQLPVTTYQAYNYWGGKSLYQGDSGTALPWGSSSGTRAKRVSFNRPYAVTGVAAASYGLGAGDFIAGFGSRGVSWDYNMVRWLERWQYDVGYITNIDTHRSPDVVANAGLLMSHGHDEYWSWQMRANVEAARDAGVNLAFFSANTAYWQIRLQPSPATGAADRVMAAYKEASLDPFFTDSDPTNDRYVTVKFRDPPVSLPEERFKGSQYVTQPVDSDLIVTNASHWVFNGTGLANQQRIVGLLGYEVDGRFGGEPANTVTLTSTPVVSPLTGQPGQHAQMTIYAASSGAQVFGTGSIQWSWGLDDFNAPTLRTSRLNNAAVTITRNVLSAFGAQPLCSMTSAAPVVTHPSNQESMAGHRTSLQISATDANCDALSYGASGLPSGLAIDTSSGLISGIPSVAGNRNVTVTVNDGKGGTDSVNFTWTVSPSTDTTSPSVPTGLHVVSSSTTSVSLSWTASTDTGGSEVAGYRVYRDDGETAVGQVTSGTSFTDSGLSEGTSYSYRVSAYDTSGNESAKSTAVNATTLSPVSVPSVVGQSQADAQTALTSVGLVPGTVSQQYSATVPATHVISQSPTAGSSVPTGSAVNLVVSLGVAPPDGVAPTIPGSVVAVARGASRVDVSWTTSTDTGGSGLAGYRVYRSGSATALATLGATATSYSDYGRTGSTTYAYEVTAFDGAGNESGRSAAMSATTPAAATWTGVNIGAVAIPGSHTQSGSNFTLQASGTDIWGTSDQFYFVYQRMSGNGELRIRVASLQNTAPWAKAGVMIRESLAANSKHATAIVTPERGAVLHYRTTTGGSSGPSATTGTGTAPEWLRLVRSGSTFTAYQSENGQTWTQIRQVTISMGSTPYVGLVLSAVNNTVLNTATYEAANVVGALVDTTPPVSVPSVVGQSQADAQTALTSVGLVPGTVSQQYSATVPATHVISQSPTAGSSVPTGSAVNLVVSLGVAPPDGVAPTIPGSVVAVARGASRVDVSWTTSTDTGGSGLAGYRVYRSGSATALATLGATATSYSDYGRTGSTTYAYEVTAFDGAGNESGRSAAMSATTPAAATWTGVNIGAVAIPGSHTQSGSNFTLQASGTDIWGTSDQFYFVYQRMSGNGELRIRVASLQNTAPWAKAGVMIRESLAANSKHATAIVTPERGAVLHYRTTTGGSSGPSATTGTGTAPEWLRLVRSGSTFTAYQSENGQTWTQIRQVTISMGSTPYVGLVLSAVNNTVLNTATYEAANVAPATTN